MLLTVSKRLEFSASRRLFVPDWSEAENLAAFGPETKARYGTGRNYVGYFVFSGRVDPTTGMLVNISEIKTRIEELLHARFDHKFLNEDHPTFKTVAPTVENVARELFLEVAPLFADHAARLVACHLVESEDRSATCYFDGVVDENHWLGFSAARQTMSPLLSAEENEKLFGLAASPHGHGHHYWARFTFRSQSGAPAGFLAPDRELTACLASLHAELDHRHLNHDVPGLTNRPKTTESLAQYLFERMATSLPVHRVRLHERDDFLPNMREPVISISECGGPFTRLIVSTPALSRTRKTKRSTGNAITRGVTAILTWPRRQLAAAMTKEAGFFFPLPISPRRWRPRSSRGQTGISIRKRRSFVIGPRPAKTLSGRFGRS